MSTEHVSADDWDGPREGVGYVLYLERTVQALREQAARYENGRIVMMGELKDAKQLAVRLTNQLRKARRDMECNDPGNARTIFEESQE